MGKIVDVEVHPKAERLYIEKIDVGEPEGPRQIISGLREHYTLEEMLGKEIVVICNLKPRKMQDVMSHGMVLCAKVKDGDKERVEFAKLPAGAKPGDRILHEGQNSLLSNDNECSTFLQSIIQ